MYWNVKVVKPLPDYRIYVEVEDGRKGIFDVKPYLDLPVFRELQDVDYFNLVGTCLGAVTWPNEQDIAPENLVAEMVPINEADIDALGWIGETAPATMTSVAYASILQRLP